MAPLFLQQCGKVDFFVVQQNVSTAIEKNTDGSRRPDRCGMTISFDHCEVCAFEAPTPTTAFRQKGDSGSVLGGRRGYHTRGHATPISGVFRLEWTSAGASGH